MSANPLRAHIERINGKISESQNVHVTGRVIEAVGTLAKAHVPNVRIGEICAMRAPDGALLSEAEVVGFEGDAAILTLYGDLLGLSSQTEVNPTGRAQEIQVGDALLGRVLNGMGKPIDTETKGPLVSEQSMPIHQNAPQPLQRQTIHSIMPTGIRVIDSTLTCGEGQRIGIFAAAGVGKSTLLSSLTRGADADVCVIALIGERGREVREFIEQNLGAEGLAKSVVVVSTSDRPPMERARAAYVATAIAEYFRERGRKVLLLMDSVTRFARALREIGLAAGEPPTRRGYPPSVFAALPQLMERAGMGAVGSITAFYTVLVEGDDMSEPIADETRSILDGHIVLSRDLASANHYPAIDVSASVSRVMSAIVESRHSENAGRLRSLIAAHKEVELLLRIGEYRAGEDALTDEAVNKFDKIKAFLRQKSAEGTPFAESIERLHDLVASR